MTNRKFDKLFGGPPRKPEAPITQKEMNLAASIQEIIEEVVIKIGRYIRRETKQKNLCLAGGVALNCVANGVLQREKIFENLWIQPAAGDAGGSLGAALVGWHLFHQNSRTTDNKNDKMRGSYLGPSFTNIEVEAALTNSTPSFVAMMTKNLSPR